MGLNDRLILCTKRDQEEQVDDSAGQSNDHSADASDDDDAEVSQLISTFPLSTNYQQLK